MLLAKDLLQRSHLSLMFIGMSGIGKTTIANYFDKEQWFHYSIDYRIGTRYLNEPIIDEIKRQMVKNPTLRALLRADSVTVLGNLHIDNLFLLSQYVGMLGDPNQGGLDWDTFVERQRLHLQAEIAAIEDIEKFQTKAHGIYGYQHFLIDSSGSICDVPIQTLATLAEHTLIIYIKAPDSLEQELIERAQHYPKPLYYEEQFLREQVKLYQATHQSVGDAGVEDKAITFEPNDFTRWVLPQLIGYRLPKYQLIADRYGITIPYERIATATSAEAVLALCQEFARDE